MIRELLDNPVKILRLFAIGALLFFIGMGFVLWADRGMQDSLEQELVAMMGLLVAGCGFTVSISAQVLLIIQRLRR